MPTSISGAVAGEAFGLRISNLSTVQLYQVHHYSFWVYPVLPVFLHGRIDVRFQPTGKLSGPPRDSSGMSTSLTEFPTQEASGSISESP